MAMFIGRNRKARTTYGFDEIALVPGNVTINPNEVDIKFSVSRKGKEPLKLAIPIIASAMDGVVDVNFAIEMGKLGRVAAKVAALAPVLWGDQESLQKEPLITFTLPARRPGHSRPSRHFAFS